MGPDKKFALLIDAENISPQYVTVILSESNNMGNVIYKRIYGNWTTPQMSNWKAVILDNAIQPMQQYNNVNGKNSSDSALIIDAMDLLYRSQLDGFCIVSSDSDFTRLASRLRESDKYVLGMGEQKTPRSFISACNKFVYLDVLYAEADRDESPAATPVPEERAGRRPAKQEPQPNISQIRRVIVKLTEENSNENGWIHSGFLGSLLMRQLPDFDVRLYGHKKFFQFVKSLDIFTIHTIVDPKNKTSKTYYFKLKEN